MATLFQDPAQMEFLVQRALPELVRAYGYGVSRQLVVWSAGCCTGEETYALAMVLSEFGARYPGLGFEFLILASDPSPDRLEKARRAIYHEEAASAVPMELKMKYLMKSRDGGKRLVRIVPELRDFVKFRKIDLDGGEFGFRESIDIIFCHDLPPRGDKARRGILLDRFCRILSTGGYLFMACPDGPGSPDVPLASVARSVFRKE